MTKLKKRTGANLTGTKRPAGGVQQVAIKIPALSEYVGVARLAVSGVASRMNFTVEQVEDIKVAVTEACSNAVQYAYGKDRANKTIEIFCNSYADRMEVIIKDLGCGFNPDTPPKPAGDDGHTHLGLGITFMKTLMDKAEIDSKKGIGTEVRLVKLLSAGK